MDCIFCKIISGEIPSKKVYEDDQEKTVQTAKEDVTAAMDAAVRSIEQNQGSVAADEARKAMIQALKAREAQNGCDGCCGCKHGEDK